MARRTKKIKRAVILGGSGFIGRALTSRLLAEGIKVTVIDPRPPAAPEAEWIAGEAKRGESTARAAEPGEVVIHLFHSSIPVDSVSNPQREREENLRPFFHLLESILPRQPGLFVYSSSGGQIYGHAQTLPLKENSPLAPISPYGQTKLAMENCAHRMCRRTGVPYLIIRFSNPYGPYQELTNRHGVIPHLFRSVLEHTPFTAFGAEESIRDYIYIDDAAEAVWRLLRAGPSNWIVNIGTGVGTSLAELICLVEKVSESKIEVIHHPRRPFDVKANVLDVSRLKKLTGFTPTVPLEEGLARTWEYLKKKYHEKI